jgi:DNA-binding NtrC family response regulator
MTDARVTKAADPARLLLIDGRSALAELAGPLTAEFALPPIVVELTSGRSAIELLKASAFDLVAADLAVLGDIAAKPDDCIARLARAAAGALVLIRADACSVSASLTAMRAGAHDCVGADLDPMAVARRIGELARRHGKAHLLVQAEPQPRPAVTDQPAAIPMMRDLVLPMWRQEQRIIEDAIQSFAGNIALAAAALELSPSTIYRKRQAWAEMEMKRA